MRSLISGTPGFGSPGVCCELNTCSLTLVDALLVLGSIPSATGVVAKVVLVACKVPVLQNLSLLLLSHSDSSVKVIQLP